MEHKGTKTLETKRLILRKFTPSDIGPVYRNYASDEKVTTYMCWKTHESIDVTAAVVNDWVEQSKNDDFYQWAIVPKDMGELIGTISVVGRNEQTGMLHIGYCIGSKWWHQGYTSEAFAAVIDFLFAEVGANRIESLHDPENVHSGDVMKKCGLKYEGTLRQADWNNRGIVDAAMHSILRSEWEKNR